LKPLLSSLGKFGPSNSHWNIEGSRPHLVFLVLALIFGLSFLVVTPPFQVPDETNHFLKAYQISTGQLMGVKEMGRVGGYVPKEVAKFSNYFTFLRHKPHLKTDPETIWNLREMKYVEDSMVFVDFPSTGKYSFVNYLPQSFSISIIRIFSDKVFWIYYGAKIFTFAFWLACVTLAIYIIPVHKWLFTALALLPMSLFVNSSLSGDVVTNASAFLLIAYLINISHSGTKFNGANFIIITSLMLVLASTKLVYTPLLLLFFLIPGNKFKTSIKRFSFFGVLILITFFTALYWYNSMDRIYTPYADYNPDFRDGLNIHAGVNMSEQLIFLKDNPAHIITVLYNATGHTFDTVYEGFIGTFGWLDTRLPLWLIRLGYLILVGVAIIEPIGSKNAKPRNYRIIPVLSFIAILSLIILTMYLTWTLVGADYVHIQGRYLIPAAPLLFIILYSRRLNFPKLTPLLVMAFAILSLSMSYRVLVDRYYHGPQFDSTQITCGAEEVNQDHFITNDPDVFLGNPQTQSSEQARTGDFCAKVDPGQQYSFTYRIKNIEYGDIIRAEVWRLGEDAGLVLSSADAKELYIVQSKSNLTQEAGWDHLQLQHLFHERVSNNEVVVYVFNFGPNTVYFDDLHITIERVIK
jgi:uncharacterized membrane protein